MDAAQLLEDAAARGLDHRRIIGAVAECLQWFAETYPPSPFPPAAVDALFAYARGEGDRTSLAHRFRAAVGAIPEVDPSQLPEEILETVGLGLTLGIVEPGVGAEPPSAVVALLAEWAATRAVSAGEYDRAQLVTDLRGAGWNARAASPAETREASAATRRRALTEMAACVQRWLPRSPT